MIYFVQPPDGGPIKIGFSGNVPDRLKQLEGAYGRPLVVLATMEGDEVVEREIHARFSHLRFGRTEQFRPEADLLAFIGKPLFASAVEVEAMARNPNRRPPAMSLKAWPEWSDWLEEFRQALRAKGVVVNDSAGMVDLAMVALAQKEGFRLPPER